MPKTVFKRNREVAPEQLVKALTDVMQATVPLGLRNTRITPEEAWQVLAYASVNRLTLESACDALPGAPSGNRLREVLLPALPPRAELQRRLNQRLRQQLHPSLWKKPRGLHLAIDLVLIPYHGQPQTDEAEVVRGEAKAGTTHFHGYATATIVHDKRRYTLAIRFVQLGETMNEIVRWLLDRVKRLKIRLRRVYLDAGFANVPVLRTLKRRQLAYLLPLPARGRSGGVRTLFTRAKSYWGYYTLHSQEHGAWTVKTVVVQRYLKGRYGKHGRKWFAYAIADLPRGTPPHQVFEWYRRRFGIESTYRQLNHVRARTTSRSPVLRLLLVGLAVILVNLHVALRRLTTLLDAPAGAPTAIPFSLDRLADLIRHVVQSLIGGQRSLCFRHFVTVS
jgi:putative transposase